MPYTKQSVVADGKTKTIWKLAGHDGKVILQAKDDITALDDPSRTKQFATKGAFSTTTTCRVFELLKKAGIPVAYKEQVSPNEFVATQCTMIPLEVVARRFAVGSYLKRHPNLIPQETERPYRFHRLVIEFFLKTTGGRLIDPLGSNGVLIEGLDPGKGQEDPFIPNPGDENWKLFHSKMPSWHEEADLHKTLKASQVIADGVVQERIKEMEDILRRVFLVLEGAWNVLGHRFIDLKIEFGFSQDKSLLVADVIDNDSWRLKTKDWEELSKETFRQGEELGEVEEKYRIVASLAEQLVRIPKQALVLWKGSKGDVFQFLASLFDPLSFGIDRIEITLSGHKQPRKCLDKLEEIMGEYPDGGVIVVNVGRSNGLGPMLAARTSWPVIVIPATMESNPQDVWSSVRMPSNVPLVTAWPEGNAVLAAFNVLASRNPLLYARRQGQIEELDI